jgi:hypothetical protein
MFIIGATNTLDTFHCGLVADVTAERVARIGRVDNQTTAINNRHGLLNQASLRIVRVNFEELRHNQI